MEKRKYTKIQALEAEIVSMHEGGKTHREIAEYLGLERIQIKKCMERFRHRQRGYRQDPRAAPARMELLRIKVKPQSLRECGWKTICCGIFWSLAEGGAEKSKISCDIPSPE